MVYRGKVARKSNNRIKSPVPHPKSTIFNLRGASISTDDDDDASSIAPIFNVARRLGAENQGYFSFGAGAFFNAYGFGLFGGWTFAEKIRIGGLVGVTAHVSDDGDFDDEHYETVDEGDTLVQLGVNYLF